MEKTVPNKHSRRHSTGNLMLELTGYEGVLSRYLSPPVPSCHDHCKPHSPGFDHPTQPKPTRKRSNKTDVDSVQGLKKPFTPIPKSQTRNVKSQSIESKRQDFKSKSKSEETDPFYITPARIARRYSDVNLPTNSLGEVGGLVRSGKIYEKINSRKDVKPVKCAAKMPGPVYGSTKPRVDHGSKKSKSAGPAGEVVQEKSNKSQSQNDERVLQNGAPIASKSDKDETPRSESQSNGTTAVSAVKKTENPTRVRKQAKENEEFSSQKLKFKNGKVIGSQFESGSPRKAKFGKGKVVDENKTVAEDGKSLRRLTSDGVLQTPESNSVSVLLKPCDVEEKKQDTRLNNVIEETASRLIKTRKSKVQALVGAFEMVSANEY
ncbi:hypothetical protein SSX86_024881 [Deinandra increscens subsp. villosa]|uniref:Calmodulin-binding domain-containing protein n=1 Tax=Deinandra increscens subsp. villosa TaxID=3103831 RepID=A0AAP0CGN7_9ASTR